MGREENPLIWRPTHTRRMLLKFKASYFCERKIKVIPTAGIFKKIVFSVIAVAVVFMLGDSFVLRFKGDVGKASLAELNEQRPWQCTNFGTSPSLSGLNHY